MPDRLVPAILTYNEEPNIGRTLDALCWAPLVVVLDSCSTDRTEAIARSYPNVLWMVRAFDNHAAQWRVALDAAAEHAEFVLALDADMVVPAAFRDEFDTAFLASGRLCAVVPFDHRLLGHPMRGTLLQPQLRLFHARQVRVEQAGHTQHFACDAPPYHFQTAIIHDDRKPLEDWLRAQSRYSALECARIAAGAPRGRDRLRAAGLMPLVAWFLAYLRAGGPFGGRAAYCYALERLTYESLLAMRVLRQRLAAEKEKP
ncbi:MAG: glycosyltransferase family 2 protein [Bryobacteraceae bacterium]|jgi:glycosyltransferase involved in cell wall biosynthesis